ncbi:MAG: protein translocase subunit SecF [Ignavibacteriaceae bacterium]|nr:protein translocase subunit SecF [Ignavibacterium sp.]MCC6254758.1 protein translocase subunit SecF [Ignavibacteriaceae bacterium]HMN25151.1 protein translocase subunit SecF [Ignavibacteriaceae bacterium]HRN26598.1 protein translocase subunit SecF [Ignavibacteriaceae bacterium]HRP93758.1 protein translocase subunit SecF [Ignavibacteriaceae bacterium]
MRVFHNLNVDFLGKRKFFYIFSLVLFGIGVLSVIFKGLSFGIDFKGGSEIVLQFDKQINIAEVRKDIENIGLGNVEVRTFGGQTGALIRTELQELPSDVYPQVVTSVENQIKKIIPDVPFNVVEKTSTSIRYSFPNPDTANMVSEKLYEAGFQAGRVSEEPDNTQIDVSVAISEWIKENLREKVKDNPFKVVKEDRVGPKVGDELKRDAVIAVFLSLLVILIYLGFRFKFVFAVGAVAALFHDVLITLGLYSALYGVIPGLNLDIDLSVVAAFLTLVGYSINDTVIVFDRVRENMKIHKSLPLKEVINKSINQTMSRTIITGFTTLLTVFILMLLGGDVLRAFAFTLFFGIIIGTYSSIFIASAFVLEYVEKTKKKVQFS